MSRLQQFLQSTGWFSGPDLDQILSCFRPAMIPKKQYLLRAGQICRQVAFVEHGCFRSYTEDEQLHEHILNFGFEGWWLSDLQSLEHRSPAAYHIQAIEESDVRIISGGDFFRLMEDFPKFKEGHIRLVRRSYASLMDRLQELRFKSVEERYLDMMQQQPQILQRVPQQYIAAYLGIEPESLSRLRRRLADRR